MKFMIIKGLILFQNIFIYILNGLDNNFNRYIGRVFEKYFRCNLNVIYSNRKENWILIKYFSIIFKEY